MPKRASKQDQVKVSFLLNEKKCKALDEIALLLERDRTFVINEAISAYLVVQSWQVQDTMKAIEEANSGEFATDEEVKQTFSKYMRNAH